MHIKFIKTGKGSASAAKEYLLQENDHKGVIRADVQVLRGNPEHVTQLAESLEFKHKYTSGVIAWHKDDAPTDNQIAQVLDDFERVAFAGLEPSQYAYYAVLHEDTDGAKHVHVIAPRVELSTGLSMNIAPPNHQKTYDVLVDKYNVQHDWASPKDISRQKTMTIDKMQIHADTPNVQAKKMIHEVINELVERGSIKNNSDVRTKLAEFGEITREGKDYISIKPQGFKKAVRLKGAYYEREFSVERISKEVRAEQEARIRPNQADRSREYERISEVFEDIIADRVKFNQGRYIQPAEVREHQKQDRIREQRSVQQRDTGELSEREPRTHEDKSQAMDNTNSHGHFNSPSPSVGNVGSYEVPRKQTPSTGRTKRSDSSDKENTRQVRDKELEQRHRSRERAESIQEPRRGALDSSVREKQLKEHYDAIRERIKSNLADTRADVQRGDTERISELREEFKSSSNSIQKADERSVGSDRTAEQDVREVSRIKSEYQNQYERKANDAIGRIGVKTREVNEARQGFVRAVKQCLKKAIGKVKEITQRITHSYSMGMSR